MTDRMAENLEIAEQAYSLWRGAHRHGIAPAHWNDLGPAWREAFAMVAGHAQIVPNAEIERLRAALKQVIEDCEDAGNLAYAARTAREALGVVEQNGMEGK